MNMNDIQAASMVVSNLFHNIYETRRNVSIPLQGFSQEQEDHIKDAMISLRRAMPLTYKEGVGTKHKGYEGHVDMVNGQ